MPKQDGSGHPAGRDTPYEIAAEVSPVRERVYGNVYLATPDNTFWLAVEGLWRPLVSPAALYRLGLRRVVQVETAPEPQGEPLS